MSDGRIIRRATIRGRVQGVGFRMWTAEEAEGRGLEGWARNRRDGTVEVVFAGPSAAVEAMTEACRHGPASARVEAVDVQEADPQALAERHAGEAFSLLSTV
jgi:acylphosphatase